MPLQHVVKRGDSLWGLAGRHLGDFARWPELVDYHNAEVRKSTGNRARVFPIKDPNLIFVGQILYLPIRDKHMMRSARATGTKAQAGNLAVPIDLRVEYSFGHSRQPIVYTSQGDDCAIWVEMKGKIAIEITSPDRFRYNLELVMSQDEMQCRQKLEEIYNPAIAALTAKPEVTFKMNIAKMAFKQGTVMIDSPLIGKGSCGFYEVQVASGAQDSLKGGANPPPNTGDIKVGGRSFKYHSDIELKIDVKIHPIDFLGSSKQIHNPSLANKIDGSLTPVGRAIGDYFTEKVKSIDKSMQSDYAQNQFHTFSWAASASIIDLSGALLSAVTGKTIKSGNELVGPAWNNAATGAAMVVHNIVLP